MKLGSTQAVQEQHAAVAKGADVHGCKPASPKAAALARRLSFSSSGSTTAESVVAEVSRKNAKKRVARLFTKTADGKYKVPEALVSDWNDGDQDRIVDEFLAAGCFKDLVENRS